MRVNLREIEADGTALPLVGEYTWKLLSRASYRRDFDSSRKTVFGSGQVFVLPNPALFRPQAHRIEYYIGVYLKNEPIGWTFGFSGKVRSEVHMINTGVLPAHRGKGIYSALLNLVIGYLQTMDVTSIRSRHRADNNPILVPKLKAGFTISGMEISPRFGTMVNLVYYYNPLMRKMMAHRTGEQRLDEELMDLMPE